MWTGHPRSSLLALSATGVLAAHRLAAHWSARAFSLFFPAGEEGEAQPLRATLVLTRSLGDRCVIEPVSNNSKSLRERHAFCGALLEAAKKRHSAEAPDDEMLAMLTVLRAVGTPESAKLCPSIACNINDCHLLYGSPSRVLRLKVLLRQQKYANTSTPLLLQLILDPYAAAPPVHVVLYFYVHKATRLAEAVSPRVSAFAVTYGPQTEAEICGSHDPEDAGEKRKICLRHMRQVYGALERGVSSQEPIPNGAHRSALEVILRCYNEYDLDARNERELQELIGRAFTERWTESRKKDAEKRGEPAPPIQPIRAADDDIVFFAACGRDLYRLGADLRAGSKLAFKIVMPLDKASSILNHVPALPRMTDSERESLDSAMEYLNAVTSVENTDAYIQLFALWHHPAQ